MKCDDLDLMWARQSAGCGGYINRRVTMENLKSMRDAPLRMRRDETDPFALASC